LLAVGRGDRLAVLFATALGFTWLLRHWQSPTWLYVTAMLAGWLVFTRYRWITGGRERVKEAIQEGFLEPEERGVSTADDE
jgi:hypothetical protein